MKDSTFFKLVRTSQGAMGGGLALCAIGAVTGVAPIVICGAAIGGSGIVGFAGCIFSEELSTAWKYLRPLTGTVVSLPENNEEHEASLLDNELERSDSDNEIEMQPVTLTSIFSDMVGDAFGNGLLPSAQTRTEASSASLISSVLAAATDAQRTLIAPAAAPAEMTMEAPYSTLASHSVAPQAENHVAAAKNLGLMGSRSAAEMPASAPATTTHASLKI